MILEFQTRPHSRFLTRSSMLSEISTDQLSASVGAPRGTMGQRPVGRGMGRVGGREPLGQPMRSSMAICTSHPPPERGKGMMVPLVQAGGGERNGCKGRQMRAGESIFFFGLSARFERSPRIEILRRHIWGLFNFGYLWYSSATVSPPTVVALKLCLWCKPEPRGGVYGLTSKGRGTPPSPWERQGCKLRQTQKHFQTGPNQGNGDRQRHGRDRDSGSSQN